jgi:epoxyqueuosine reductase
MRGMEWPCCLAILARDIRYTRVMEKTAPPQMAQPQTTQPRTADVDFSLLAAEIKTWARELGFDELGISNTELSVEEEYLQQWLTKGFQGEMDYMARHGTARSRPHELIPGTVRVISVRLNYLANDAKESWSVMEDAEAAFVSRYTLGRDYHKVMRAKLQKLADKITAAVGDFAYRVFTDSAPVMEVAIARKAGLGWRGKHTLLLTREAGSMFFLGEIYTDLPLPISEPTSEHCGTCTKCIDICPTQAIVAPYQIDARRCISYLTIEHKGSIPVEFRTAMGNRIYGCDDCQLACPWNKFAQLAVEKDFAIRHQLDDIGLLDLWAWTAEQFNDRMEGSAIRRIGYEQWQRNITVAMGNALRSTTLNDTARDNIRDALNARLADASALVREHIAWALEEA